MNEARPFAVRILAALIAAAGTPYAIVILVSTFVNPAIPLLFAPGWFVYVALIWTAFGWRLRGDPFTTWISCMIVNGFWVWQLNPYFEFDSRDSILRHYTTIYSWAAVLVALVALIIELCAHLQIRESIREVRKWLNSR
ncbi:MAG TPA: hypothetical protein VHD36_10415 [Pirellulales bacterium]|nr:hypothetical protein [Pirellulales bacterium]